MSRHSAGAVLLLAIANVDATAWEPPEVGVVQLDPTGQFLNCTFNSKNWDLGEAACRSYAGNERVQCYPMASSIPEFTQTTAADTDAGKPAWGICACDTYYGYGTVQNDECNSTDMDTSRFLEKCIIGPDGCSKTTWSAYAMFLLGFINFSYSIAMLIRGGILTFQLAKSKKGLHLDALGFTLCFLLFTSFTIAVWNFNYMYSPLVKVDWYTKNVMNAFALPFSAVAYVVSGLNICLMWIQVVSQSKTLKTKGASNIGHSAKIFVFVFGAVFFVLVSVAFGYLASAEFGAGVSLLYIMIMAVLFKVAAKKLAALLGGGGGSSKGSSSARSQSGQSAGVKFIIRTSNKMVLWYVAYIVSTVGYVMWSATKTKPMEILVKQILVFCLCASVIHGVRVLFDYVAYNTRKARGVSVTSINNSGQVSTASISSSSAAPTDEGK